MELFFFDHEVLTALPKAERSKYLALVKAVVIPDGRPFFIGADGRPDTDLDGFCTYLLDPRRGSRNTWKTYANQVAVFLRFLEMQKKSWKDVNRDDLKAYYRVRTTGEFQIGPAIKGQSWNVVKSALVHLYEYAVDSGLIEAAPFKYRRSKAMFGGATGYTADFGAKPKPEPINFISIRQYKDIWRPVLAQGRNAQRNLALTDLLITVGLRISEALSLQTHQIPDPDNLAYAGKKSVTLRVVGKGKKPRLVLVPKRILRAIRFYIEEDREVAVASFLSRSKTNAPEAVFLSERGTVLSPRSVQAFFSVVSEHTGLHLTPHGCRHTFAVYQLEAMIKRMAKNLKALHQGGADAYRQVLNDPLRQLQLLLGHSQLATTYLYLDFIEESEALVEESLADWTSWETSRDS